MAHQGGGAEARARFKQFEYKTNASLVLTTDNPPPRATHEPSGEPESLWGKIDPKSFGDRAYRDKPPELEEKLKKSKKKKDRDPVSDAAPRSKKRRLQEESVLTSSDEGVYQPKTKETRAAYEAMLSVIQQQLGGQPLNIVSGAADEILSVLKNENIKNPDKKKEIEKLLNVIPSHTFDQLVSIGKLITDYHDSADTGDVAVNGDDGLDDDVGVAVEFEENEEEEEESDLDMVPEDEDEDDDLADVDGSGAMQMGGGIDDDDDQEANEGMSLNVQDIDAYWLQRKISQAYDQQIDPQQSQKLAEEVLKILAEGDDREVETKLLVHLQFEQFKLIKFLLRNRLKIVFCTRLARAEDQDKRKEIEDEMMELGSDHAAILEQLHATRATAKERQKILEKSIREEARRLKDESGGDGDRDRRDFVDRDADGSWLKGQRQLLDLESLSFHQGGLLLTENVKCLLVLIETIGRAMKKYMCQL